MDSPSLDSAGSPVSSIDASERPSASNNKHIHGDDSKMHVDENTPLPPSSADGLRKRKTEDSAKENSKSSGKQDKRSTSPQVLQSERQDGSDGSDDDCVVVTSKQAKRPKLAESEKKTKSSTPARPTGATASTSKTTTAPSSSAVKDASDSAIVQFKNGKLLLKQKKIDFSQQNAALQLRIEWNSFIEDVEEALAELPEKFHPLVALMIHESDRSAAELAKTIKNALNPPLTGDEDSQGDDNIDKLPLNIVTKTVNLLADRVNHGFRDTPASSTKSKVVTIDDSDDGEAGSTGDKQAKAAEEQRDLPKGYETVPTGLRLYRWEVKKVLRGKMFECLPKDMQEKIEARAEERLAARDEAKKLLSAMSKSDRKEILLKGVKNGNDDTAVSNTKAKKNEKGKEKEEPEKKSKATSGEDKPTSSSKKAKKEDDDATSSTEKEKVKPGRKPKELTEEEKQKKEAGLAEKEKKKAEREAAKAVKEAAKAEKEVARAEKEAAKAEKEAIKAKQEQAKKAQRNVFGAWLAKAGTSPVEVLNNPTASSSHSRHASSSSTSERGSLPPAAAAVAEQSKTRPSRDYYSTFRPFFVRAGVEVAPYNRFANAKGAVKKEEADDMELEGTKEVTPKESLAEFLSRAATERIPSSSKLEVQPLSTVMTALQECEIRGDMDAYHRLRAQLRNTDKYPIKLLKFHADVRPGYIGTWTKTSSTISGRNPYGRDTNLLDYDYDSEAEWDEDPEDAEDIKEDSGDEEMLEESDDDLDGWLAGDDEVEFEAGYEGELSLADLEDDSNNPFAQPAGENGKKKAKKAGKPLVKKKKVTGPLIPVIRGPYWEDEEDEAEDTTGLSKFMSTFKISWLGQNNCGTLDPFAFVEKKTKASLVSSVKIATAMTNADGTAKTDKLVVNGPMQVKKPEVPSDLHHLFEEAVLASKSTTKPVLVEDVFAALQKQQARKVTKQMINRSIESMVDKKKKADVVVAADGSEGCHWQMKKLD